MYVHTEESSDNFLVTDFHSQQLILFFFFPFDMWLQEVFNLRKIQYADDESEVTLCYGGRFDLLLCWGDSKCKYISLQMLDRHYVLFLWVRVHIFSNIPYKTG